MALEQKENGGTFYLNSKMCVILIIMVQIGCFTINRAGRIGSFPVFFPSLEGIWCELVLAFFALVFLIPIFIFSIAIKIDFVVAFWAADLV